MTPSQMKRQVTPSHQHDSHTEHTRSQVSIDSSPPFVMYRAEQKANNFYKFIHRWQPRWRFIRRRFLQQQRSTWIRATLHPQQPHGIRANKPSPATICEKSIRLVDVPKVAMLILKTPFYLFSLM